MSTIPTQMSGVYMTGHGDYDCLDYRTDIPVPQPGAGDVLIKVGSSAINNTDINTRIAWYSKGDSDADDASWSGNALQFPRIQGADVCGEIVAVGEGVDTARIGERVLVEPCVTEAGGEVLVSPWYFGSECDGGFAEYCRVAARHAYKVECDLTDEELATFPCSYSTAENLLTRAQVGEGDVVLVTGASGGVGSAAVQLSKARGATVYAITSPAKAETLTEIGADKVMFRDDDLMEKLGPNSVSVVIDLVGGEAWPVLLDVMRPKGRYAVSGAIAGAIVDLDLRTLYLKDLTFHGCTVIEPEVFGNLIARIENGDVKPLLAETFALKDIVKAQEAFLQKGHVGKIALSLK